MNFASFPYLLFLAVVMLFYNLLNLKYKPIFLLVASYFFYSTFGFGFMFLMLVTTVITYFTSYYSYYSNNLKHRSIYFYSGLIIDLLIFILFKYIHIIDIDVMNWPNWSMQKLLIPIGISFYTFKTIGYCIDVYKRKYEPENSILYYTLSVSFFPQLIAGPIEKSVAISSQLKQNKAFNIQNTIEGSKLILWGFFKKIVIADSIGQIINPMFYDIKSYGGIDYFILFMAFSYQVYVDFSGYSDIAIGSAKFFGVDLPSNFNKPFFSKNYREFWTRWHSSFSKWLKEYIFNQMGGISKTNKLKTIFNIFILFVIVGLWHGATLNYFIYAQIAFVFLLVDILTRKFRKKLQLNKIHTIKPILNYVAMILLCMALGIFYKPSSFNESLYIAKHLFDFHHQNLISTKVLALFLYILVFEIFQYLQITPTGHCFQRVPNFYIRLSIVVFMIFTIILINSREEQTFQYFQF